MARPFNWPRPFKTFSLPGAGSPSVTASVAAELVAVPAVFVTTQS
jgi:hypothetical protein